MALPTINPYQLPTREELPRARVTWQPSNARAALLVHDMQRYFVRAFPAGVSPIDTVIANIRMLRDACDRLAIPVFYTAQPVKQLPEVRGLQRDFWGPGMQSETDDHPIAAGLEPLPHHTVLTKWRYSAFQRSTFREDLATAGRDQLIVTGVFAHIGCLVTTAEAFMLDVQPFFVGDAVADFSRAHHDVALAQVAGCTGRVMIAEDVLHALSTD